MKNMKLNTVVALAGFTLATTSGAGAATISGNIAFMGWAASLTTPVLQYNIVDSSIPAVIDSGTFSLNANGTYSFVAASTPPGTYDIYVDGPQWLQQASFNVSVGATGTANYILIPGDIDNDQEVSVADYAELFVALNSNSSSINWNPIADLNGDGWVDMLDFSLLSFFFGMVGDTF